MEQETSSSRSSSRPPSHPNSRPTSRSSSRPSSSANNNAPTRKLSIASAAVEQARANKLVMSEKQQAIEFLMAANQDYERILATTNVQRDNVLQFADGARAILATMRMHKEARERESDTPAVSNAKDVFKEVLQSNMTSSLLDKCPVRKPDRESKEQRTRLPQLGQSYPGAYGRAPPLHPSVRRRPRAIEPMPDRVKQRVADKLLLQGEGTGGLPKVSNRLSGELKSRGIVPTKKKKDLVVVTGSVNYSTLLNEQAELAQETDKKEKQYQSMMQSFDDLNETFHRRFSLLLKQEGSLLNIDGSNNAMVG
eukprot:TRINITY_DN76263_c0_g1_i1.p1 TRINITY_DN76263_c0_g1~~TRINITY_DN76263_c0_g1_i1.p1  ORF type:complete len:309 (+),score=30.01 TRINITY_DN76263_c0_g1_i1:49-975(+)